MMYFQFYLLDPFSLGIFVKGWYVSCLCLFFPSSCHKENIAENGGQVTRETMRAHIEQTQRQIRFFFQRPVFNQKLKVLLLGLYLLYSLSTFSFVLGCMPHLHVYFPMLCSVVNFLMPFRCSTLWWIVCFIHMFPFLFP